MRWIAPDQGLGKDVVWHADNQGDGRIQVCENHRFNTHCMMPVMNRRDAWRSPCVRRIGKPSYCYILAIDKEQHLASLSPKTISDGKRAFYCLAKMSQLNRPLCPSETILSSTPPSRQLSVWSLPDFQLSISDGGTPSVFCVCFACACIGHLYTTTSVLPASALASF